MCVDIFDFDYGIPDEEKNMSVELDVPGELPELNRDFRVLDRARLEQINREVLRIGRIVDRLVSCESTLRYEYQGVRDIKRVIREDYGWIGEHIKRHPWKYVLLVYLFFGLMTFGYNTASWLHACQIDPKADCSGAYAAGIATGIIWPLYWLGHWAFYLFW